MALWLASMAAPRLPCPASAFPGTPVANLAILALLAIRN